MNLVLVLMMINALRAQPLVEVKELDAIAQNRAEYICSTGDFSHKYFLEFFAGSNFNQPGKLRGENLAQGFDNDARSTVFHWYLSTAHRQNIVNSRYHYTGLGHACDVTVELFAE